VTPQGPNPAGGGPDDEGAGERHEGQETYEDGAESAALRGWLPPEDRLWLHPSELEPGAHAPGPGTVGSPVDLDPVRRVRHNVGTAMIGVGAAAAVVVGIFLLLDTGTQRPTVSVAGGPDATTALTVSSGCCAAVPAVAKSTADAMVALKVSSSRGIVEGCGVAVAAGGLIATTADAVSGAASIMVTTAGGRKERATVVGMDKKSDIALLRVSDNLPVARFTDAMTERTQRPVVVMAVMARPVGGSTPRPATVWAASTIKSVGSAVTGGDASGMASVDAMTSKVPALSGELLVTPSGAVIGLLDTTGTAGEARGTEDFLPTETVLGVTAQLASSGQVHHGWLGITGHDATPADHAPAGALVASVVPGGPAAGSLNPGDVITEVNGAPVRSMAELRSRLYLLGPGTPVHLEVARARSTRSVAVVLSSSP